MFSRFLLLIEERSYSRLSGFWALIFILNVLFFSSSVTAGGLMVSPIKPPEPFIKEAFPNASYIKDKSGEPAVWTAYADDKIIGYAFETDDVARIPAYSGEPVNMLVAIDTAGIILTVDVLEHHEPILLVGILEDRLYAFTDQYSRVNAAERVKIGGRQSDDMKRIDGVSGATVTVMVMNQAIMRAVTIVARAVDILEAEEKANAQPATINQSVFEPADWSALTGDGSIRRLKLSNSDVEEAFVGTEGASAQPLAADDGDRTFVDIFYTELDIPTIGKNLLGDSEFNWLIKTLKPDEHAIGLMGNGFSFKGSGYVRGGIFDRIQIHQGDNEFSFRDVEHYRINDIYAEGAPRFREMSIFIVAEHHQFDPGSPWQLELLVRRQTGPIDSVFSSFKADYIPIEKYLTRPEPVPEARELTLWEQVWQESNISIIILVVSMLLLLLVIFFQDWLVRYPHFLHNFRRAFLVYTVLFVGWYSLGQLSVVNVLTFVHSLMHNFDWQLFLLDPVIFVLWVFVAVTVLLWGRGIYCGWLCPFGALQELLSELAVKLKVPQVVVPFAIHERLWALKYLILLGLFGLSLGSLGTAERFAEVEPFKTTFLLHFDRDWPFVIYALILLFVSLFSRKVYCRYICPLGAAIAIPSGIRLFDWLKRRKECGQPCRVCANECEIGAIEPNGTINLRECHHCLDCQVTYQDKDKCPPLIKKYRKRVRAAADTEVIEVIDRGSKD